MDFRPIKNLVTEEIKKPESLDFTGVSGNRG